MIEIRQDLALVQKAQFQIASANRTFEKLDCPCLPDLPIAPFRQVDDAEPAFAQAAHQRPGADPAAHERRLRLFANHRFDHHLFGAAYVREHTRSKRFIASAGTGDVQVTLGARVEIERAVADLLRSPAEFIVGHIAGWYYAIRAGMG